MKFKVDKKIFETFPGVKLGVVVVLGAKVVEEAPEITKLLSEWQEKQKNEFIGVDLPNFDKIRTWREAYSKFGSKPSKYNSSIESLLKRVVSGGKLPNINSLVDLYNAISLKHVLPFGAEDLDRVKGNIRLAFAEGKEAGKYIGSDLIDTCEKGEVVYLDDFGFICRRWNWREADRTKITQETKNFILVAEAMPPVSSEQLERAIDDFLGFSSKYLGGKYQKFVIDAENPGIEVDFQTGSKLVDQDLRNLQIGIVQKIEAQKVYVGYAKEIFDSVKSATGLEDIDIDFPENEGFGDYSSNIAMAMFSNFHDEASYSFPISKFKSPRELAQHLANKLQTDKKLSTAVEKIEVAGPGFINFWLKKDILVDNLIQIDNQKQNYGTSDCQKGKVAIVEYSSPNIAKPFTIGHLRSTIIGDAIANLLEAVGWKVYRDNHLGDWGTQFGKMIYAIKTWGDEQKIQKAENPVKELVDLYVRFHTEAEKDSSLEVQAREWFKKLEDGDSGAGRLWKKCIEWSFLEFDRIYKILGVSFSKEFEGGRGLGESFFGEKMKPVMVELQERGLLKEGKEGAKLVFFENDKYPPAMILKKDGATLYHTRDLATDRYRLENYHPDLIINEVGSEQILYFQQLYEIERLLGWFEKGQRVHIWHGLIRFKEGRMSTRKGNIIWLEEVLNEAMKRAQKLGSDDPKLAQIVGIGALKWNDLKRDAKTEIVFDWDEILNMEGNSGPYIQYTITRTNSVLAKSTNYSSMAGKQIYKSTEKLKINDEEMKVLRSLSRFSGVIADSAKNYSPNTLCNYLFDLAQKFNNFYNVHRIIGSENEDSRLALTTAVGIVLKNGLKLLGIQVPARM